MNLFGKEPMKKSELNSEKEKSKVTSALQKRHREIEDTILTKEEETKALWSYKIQKWNEERNADYWKEAVKTKPSKAKLKP